MPPERPGRESDAEREEAGKPRSLPFPSPEIIREFPDRAAQWLFEDPINVRDLLRIVDPALADSLDFANARRINRTFIPADLTKIENDLLFRVPVFGDGQAVWVYLLLEHQSRVDPDMALRLLEYLFKVWEAQKREGTGQSAGGRSQQIAPIVPLVFYTGTEPWPQPISLVQAMDLPAGFDRFVPKWETLFLSLHGTTAAQLATGATAIGQALRVWQAERRPLEELERVIESALGELEGLDESQAMQWSRIVHFVLLLSFHRRGHPEYATLFATVTEKVTASHFKEKSEMVTEWKSAYQETIEMAEEKGRQEGRQEGREEGRYDGERAALAIVLKARFGDLTLDTTAKLEAVIPETLERWLAAAATARTLEEALS